MRGIVLTALLALAGAGQDKPPPEAPPPPPVAARESGDLAQLARRWREGWRPATSADAPASIPLTPEFVAALARLPVDGGRERALFFRLDGPSLTLALVVEGRRYAAPGRCADCDWTPPLSGHTHAYANPPSHVDVLLTASGDQPHLVVAHGSVWLLLPTRDSRAAPQPSAAVVGLAANRVQCRSEPRVAPAGMPQHVEAVTRATAASLHVLVYALQDGALRRLPAAGPLDLPASFDALNGYERVLLALIRQTRLAPEGLAPEFDPRRLPPYSIRGEDVDWLEEDWAAFTPDVQMTAATQTGRGAWFNVLPTTVYSEPVADLSRTEFPFASVQLNADCPRLRVLEGVQTFSPDGVRYLRGWERLAGYAGALHEGWSTLGAGELPTGHVVPW